MLTNEMIKNRTHIIALLALVLIAFSFRVYKLDAVGLSFDESHKIQAARLYRNGDFSGNIEHPMLMKTLIAFTLVSADYWNKAFVSPESPFFISDETITRLPNVVFGALMTLVLFLFAKEMFGKTIGMITAVLWATGINAISFNRIAKEDTLLVFFTFLAYYLFWKAKFLGPVETKFRERLYIASGVSFGLMMASKYFPHYLGLNYLFHYTRKHEPQANYRISKEIVSKFFVALFLAFVIANPSLFLPSNISYLFSYWFYFLCVLCGLCGK